MTGPVIPIVDTPLEHGQMALAEAAARMPDYMRAGTLQLHALPPLSLYVHLPWCLRKCPYCDFNSHEWRGEQPRIPELRYVQALVADLETALPLIWGRRVTSIFFGGGTPSLFSPDAVDALLAQVRARVQLASDAEITLEANPGTFERERFKAYAQAGVNRLSIGVQSFDDDMLGRLGRVHDAAQARAAIEEAQTVVPNFNIDLMFALPGQTVEHARAEVAKALAFQPAHLSLYQLTIEPQTAFAKRPPAHLPDGDLAADMQQAVADLAQADGLDRYEVSAYARPGHACRHNRNYWDFGDYLGIGAGAHSKLSFAHRIIRQTRWRQPERYMQQAVQGAPVESEAEIARRELPFEFLLNALRLREGFATELYTQRTGLPLSTLRAGLEKANRLGLVRQTGEFIAATPRGWDLLNEVLTLFLPSEQDRKPRSIQSNAI
ncbi:radical SAM family heme chaperone HemW [Thiomonas sp. FB-Cd]|uniref:radical SAM family heme chaperone HemW n=1 Tax=Thiomonas sp. FB-Cd TaxID=1158292 RepID=UPI00056E6BE9